MKKSVKIFLAGLAFCSVVTLSTVGIVGACKRNKQQATEPTGQETEKPLEKTNYNVVAEGKSSYKIVIPDNAGNYVNTAATELQFFLEESTGVRLDVVKESAKGSAESVISLGNTGIASESGISATYSEVSDQGYKIKTVNDDLYIVAAKEIGVLYGVYELLEDTLNYDFFFKDVYTIDKVSTLPLYQFDKMDKPDLGIRCYTYGFQRYDVTTANRMRVINNDSIFARVGGSYNHNSMDILPMEEFGENGTIEKHSEWYAASKEQLCFTAHGNEESFKRMVEVTAEKMFNALNLDEYKNYDILSMCLEDIQSKWCSCGACTDMINNIGYGAASTTIVNFLNHVCVALENKLKNAGDARAETFRIYTFAYFDCVNAPVAKGEDGNYVYHESMRMNPHFVPYFAPIKENFTVDFSTTDSAEIMRRWSAISDNMFFWGYNSYFNNWMIPYDTFSSIQDLYRFAKEMDVSYIYVQAQQLNPTGSTGFSLLSAYLQSKLGWDVDVDISALSEKFFAAMYGSEAKNMQKYFSEWRTFSTYQLEELKYPTYVSSLKINDPQFFPKSVLVGWLDDLYAIQERLMNSGELKAAYNVRIEMLFPLYMTVQYWKDTLVESELLKYKTDYYNYANEIGITNHEEHAEINQLWKSWGMQ